MIAAVCADVACAQASAAIPETITSADGRLAWISTRHALDESGRLNSALVDSPALRANAKLRRKHRQMQADATAAPEECRTFLGTPSEHFKSTASLQDVAAGAEVIVSGRVVSTGEGFLHNLPGSLLRLAGSTLKGETTGEIFLFYPYARIRTADGLVCARPVGQYLPPAVGDRLIVFSMTPAFVSEGRTILSADPPREIIHQSATGRRLVPAAFTGELDADLTLDDVVTRVAGETRRGGRSK
ncbi:MAG TPA: hypothetical protein VF432_04590 [Thermoanaerobaculia bacterium]